MNYFPSTCIDSFFNDFDFVFEFAKSVEYVMQSGTYPGKRSDYLHNLNPTLFHIVCRKIFSTFYDVAQEKISWNVSMVFQKIEPFENQNILYPHGWVHADETIAAGVVYLNKNSQGAGTALYSPKTPLTNSIHSDIKQAFFGGEEVEIDLYNRCVEENNNQFTQSVLFEDTPNRLIMYDGAQFHAAQNIMRLQEPRHTLVFFVKNVDANRLPIPNTRVLPL